MKPDDISPKLWSQYNIFFLLEHFLGRARFLKLFRRSEKSLLAKIESNLIENQGIGENSEQSPMFDEFGPKFANSPSVTSSRVQVYRAQAKDWSCVRNWDLSFFQNRYGDKEVTILNSKGLFEEGVQELGNTTLGNYIEELKKGSKAYLKFSPVIQDCSELRSDFDEHWLNKFTLPGSFGKKYFLFIGPDKSQTPIHTALSNTVFVQAFGKKKWTLWEPRERLFLGVRPERMQYFFSRFDPNKGEQNDFVLSKYAKKIEITLNEGDVLWFPGFYWHHVENIGNSIGVAYKTAHLPSSFRNSKVLTILSFLATRPSMLESLIKSGFKNNERIFLN